MAHLSVDLLLSASSVKVHRASICITIRQGGFSLSDDPLLTDVSRGVYEENQETSEGPGLGSFLVPRSPAPFEPLGHVSLMLLVLKTAFLVTLTSVHQCCEVYTLSGC